MAKNRNVGRDGSLDRAKHSQSHMYPASVAQWNPCVGCRYLPERPIGKF